MKNVYDSQLKSISELMNRISKPRADKRPQPRDPGEDGKLAAELQSLLLMEEYVTEMRAMLAGFVLAGIRARKARGVYAAMERAFAAAGAPLTVNADALLGPCIDGAVSVCQAMVRAGLIDRGDSVFDQFPFDCTG